MAERMKPSGIDWIGDIPASWKRSKVKFCFSLVNGSTPESSDYDCWDGDIKWITPADMSDTGTISHGERLITKYGYNSCGTTLLPIGSIVISSRAPIGKINITTAELCTNQGCKSLIRTGDNRYFYYLFLAGQHELSLLGRGTTFLELSTYDLNGFGLVIPAEDEQKAIADFLDKECAQIDSIAADLEKQIAILQQYKKSLITETVTKGLDKSVPMKDSGVEWIGEIPNTWDCKKMKYIISEPLQYGANEAGDDYKEDYPRYIRITDITEENSLKDDGKLSLSLDIAKPYLLKDGDLLFARSGATVGKTFYYTSNYGTCAFAGYLIKARFNQDKMNPKFVYYTTLGIGYENWKNTVFTQATIQNIGADKYAQLYITVPSMKEQNEIIAYLDTQCKAIDDVIHSKYQQLSTIQQHKKSLIYEYVTGKKTSEGGAVRWPSKQGN